MSEALITKEVITVSRWFSNRSGDSQGHKLHAAGAEPIKMAYRSPEPRRREEGAVGLETPCPHLLPGLMALTAAYHQVSARTCRDDGTFA